MYINVYNPGSLVTSTIQHHPAPSSTIQHHPDPAPWQPLGLLPAALLGPATVPRSPPINRSTDPCQSSSRAFSKAPCCWLSLAGVISGLSMSSWHMERSFHVKGSGLCEKITRKIQPNKFLSACQRWLWMWVVLRKKKNFTHLFKWERWLKDPLYRLQHNWMLGIWYKYCQYISASDWDFKKGYPEINAFKAVLPTVEDILLLLLYFGRCIIAAWFHNLPTRRTLQKWNSNKTISLMMEFQQFPASEKLWKSNNNVLTTNHPALKGFCTNDTAWSQVGMSSLYWVSAWCLFGLPQWCLKPEASWQKNICHSVEKNTSFSSQNKLFLYNLI